MTRAVWLQPVPMVTQTIRAVINEIFILPPAQQPIVLAIFNNGVLCQLIQRDINTSQTTKEMKTWR
jgi:hypothetical protein